MIFSDDLDDDFSIKPESEKLDKLFEENTLPDISFKLSAGKPPPSNKPKPKRNSIPLKVIFAKSVEAFQMKDSGYKMEGKVGIAIIGNDELCYYQLYLYKNNDKKVASVEMNFNFHFVVQEHHYASFKDMHDIQWSVHFDKASDLTDFCREVAIARWKSAKGAQQKLVQEALKGRTDLTIKKDDIVCISYKGYQLTKESLVKMTDKEESQLPDVVAPAGCHSWEVSPIGTCIKSKRFIITKPGVTTRYGKNLSLERNSDLLWELDVKEVIPYSPASDLPHPDSISHSSESKPAEKERAVDNLPGRMAKIGYALPSFISIPQPHSDSSSTQPANSTTQPTISSTQGLLENAKPDEKNQNQSPFLPNQIQQPREDNHLSSYGNMNLSEINILVSEVRTSNSEMRMNINRVTDKVDTVISKVDHFSQINDKMLPALEKIDSVHHSLNVIMEHNNKIMNLIQMHSPVNLESTIQEVTRLKKRNSELESYLEVSKSNSEILKDKIFELNEKISLLEKQSITQNCQNCIDKDGADIKKLEETVKDLRRNHNLLLEANRSLSDQNQQLSNELTYIKERENKVLCRKKSQIEELENEVETLKQNLAKTNNDSKNKNIQGFVIQVHQALRDGLMSQAQDNFSLDNKISKILKDEACAYVGSDQGFVLPPLSRDTLVENTGTAEKPSSHRALPIPRPRKPPSEPCFRKPDSLSESVQSSKEEPDTQEKHVVLSAPNEVTELKIDDIGENIRKDDTNLQNVREGTGNSNFHDDEKYETQEIATHLSNPYSTNYQTPLLPTSPPPIFDD